MICAVLMLDTACAETLSAADREALLETLEKLRESAGSKVDGKIRTALAAFRGAAGDDGAAIELYLNCMELVNFDEQHKKASDFREWKRKEAEKLSDPALRTALRLQLRWLILTLQSVPEDADRQKLGGEARQLMDSIFAEAEKLSGQEGLLGQSVMGTVFARAYEITQTKVENWPQSPIQIEAIYSQIIFPPLRNASRLEELRAAWIKRIYQEGAVARHWSKKGDGKGDDDRKGLAGAASDTSPAYEKFVENTQPKLQWEMEVDLFRAGDESGAASRMLGHLQKYISHASAKAWSDELVELLNPTAPAETAAPAETGVANP